MPSCTAPARQRRRLQSPLGTAVIAIVAVIVAVPASAQEVWGELRLSGGARHARSAFSLGSHEDRPDSAWLFDYLSREFSDAKVLGATPFERYVAVIEAAQALQAEWPGGVALPSANAAAPERSRAETALRTLGLALRRRGNVDQAELDPSEVGVERVAALRSAGIDVPELALALNAGRSVRVSLSDSRLPLPLPTYWSQQVFTKNVSPIVAIVRSRVHSLLYLGLLALDDETLRYLQARPELMRRLGTDAPSAFAAFGRSLRVRNNAIEVPGGEEAIAVWRDLVGRAPQDVERFTLSLLTRDGGKLAYFYDTVAHLSPEKQQFVLGKGLEGADRFRFVGRIATHFASAHPDWKIESRPFSRPAFDPAVAMTFVDVLPDGSIGPAWLPPLLERVGAGDPWQARPDQTFGALPNGYPDALWMMDWLFAQPREAQSRFALLRFAQRRFAQVPKELAPRVGVALLSARDLPALPRALERMSVTDPAVYADMAIAAYNLTLSGSADEITPVVARWQAAFGLLEQAHRRRALDEPALRTLLASLAKMTPGERRNAPGAVAAWVIEQLLPTLVPDGPIDELEVRALRAFTAGRRREPVRFSWEGLQYVLDTENAAFRSALALRQDEQRQVALPDLVRLHAVRRAMEQVKTLDDLGGIVRALKDLEPTLGRLAASGESGARVVRDLRSAMVQLDRIRTVTDLDRVSRALAVLLDAIDVVTDASVPPLVYALAIAPSREPPAVYRDTWRAHSLRPPPGQVFGSWMHSAWKVPEVDARVGGGLMLRGAMLSVDVVLADAVLLRAASDGPPRSTLLHNRERDTLLRYLAFGHTQEFPGESPLAALDAGRRRVGAWATEIPASSVLQDRLRRAAINEWRANVLAWEAHHADTGLAPWLTPLETLRVASTTPLASSWSGPAPLFDGCHCFRSLDLSSPDVFRDRESGVLIALVPNLPLRLAEHLRTLDLPVSLVPALLPVAVQDWIDNAGQMSSGDWEASAGWLRRLSRDRVEEYLLSLVAARVLVPPAASGPQ